MSKKKQEAKVLSDHKKVGSQFVPPLLAQMGPKLKYTRWLDNELPEVLWIALLMDRYGAKRGVELALELAQVTYRTVGEKAPTTAYSMVSDYRDLNESHWRAVKEQLGEDRVYDLGVGLWPLISLYRECYLRGLFGSDWEPDQKQGAEASIRYLESIVRDMQGRRDKMAMFAQATLVYIMAVNGRLHYTANELVPDLEAMSEYPDTERSRKVAGSIRATMITFAGMDDRPERKLWAEYFWRHGFDISVCTPATAGEEDGTEGIGIDMAALHECGFLYEKTLPIELMKTWNRTRLDLAHPLRAEVQVALVARQARLATSMATTPSLWAYDLSQIVLRCMVDTHITLAWLIARGTEDHYDRFVEYGLGQEKLLLEHLRARYEEGNPSSAEVKERIEGMEAWIDSQLATFLLPVNVGSWTSKSVRELALEADCKDIYALAYTPYSAVVHGSWNAIARLNLTLCMNPLHKLHRIPNFEAPPYHLNRMLEAARIMESTFRLWEKACKVEPVGESCTQNLIRDVRKILRVADDDANPE